MPQACCRGIRFDPRAPWGAQGLCLFKGAGIGLAMRPGGAVPWIAKRRVVWSHPGVGAGIWSGFSGRCG